MQTKRFDVNNLDDRFSDIWINVSRNVNGISFGLIRNSEVTFKMTSPASVTLTTDAAIQLARLILALHPGVVDGLNGSIEVRDDGAIGIRERAQRRTYKFIRPAPEKASAWAQQIIDGLSKKCQ